MNTPQRPAIFDCPLARKLHLNRSRLMSLMALLTLALGSLGQWVLHWQPVTISLGAWDQYFFNLLLAQNNHSLSASSFFQTPQGPFGAAASLWHILGHFLNSQMADPLWQTFWRGLWRAAIIGAGYWTLTTKPNVRANWFIALAAAGIAVFPTDWQNLLFAAGTSQLIATFAGLLAIHCWLKPTTSQSNASTSNASKTNVTWWLGWGWFVLAASSAPVGVLAAIAAGVVTLVTAIRQTGRDPQAGRSQQIKGLALLFAGVIGVISVILIGLTQSGPSLVHTPAQALANLLVIMGHPFTDMLWPAAILWLPWCVLLWRSIKQPAYTYQNTQQSKLIALGLWVLMMMVLLAMGQSPQTPAGSWLNPSCMLLALLVNTACLVHCMPGIFRRFALKQRPTDRADKMNAIPVGPWLLFGWFVFLSLGYWQCANNVAGWQRSADAHLHQRALLDTQMHRYLASGDPAWLTANAPVDGAADLSSRRSWLDDPSTQAILPAHLLPPLKPANYLSIGQAEHPNFAPSAALYRHNAMGIVPRNEPPYANSRLGLRYKRQPDHHRFLLTTRTRGTYASNFEFYVKDVHATDDNQVVEPANDRTQLISPDHPLPKETLISRNLAGLPLSSTFVFTAHADIFELDLLREQSAKPGMLLFTSPQPIGFARYHLTHWLPYFQFMAGLGLVTLLVIAGRLFFIAQPGGQVATSTATESTSTSTSTPAPTPALSINALIFKHYAPLLGTLIAAAAILFIRKSDALLNPQFWAEDGSTFFAGHFHLGFAALYEPYAGYLHLVPRLIALVTGIFTPYAYVPHVYNYCTLAAMLLVIGCCFSRRLPFTTTQKCLMGLATVLMVQFSGEIYLNITNLQWFMAPLLVLLALKAAPAPAYATKLTPVKTQWAIDLLTLLLIGLTGPFIILAFPLFAMMAVVRRNRHSVALLIGAGLAVFIQMAFLLTSDRPADEPMAHDFPMSWLLPQVIGQRVFKEWMIFGLYDMYIWPALLCTLLAGVYAALLYFAARHKTLRWPLVCFVIFHGLTLAAGLFRVKAVLLTLILPSVSRYFYIPLLMLTWAVIVLLGSPVKWQRRAAIFVLACVLTSCLQTYFIARPWPDLNWRSYATQITPDKPMNIPIHPTHLKFMIRLNPQAAQSPDEPAPIAPDKAPTSSPATSPVPSPAQPPSDRPDAAE